MERRRITVLAYNLVHFLDPFYDALSRSPSSAVLAEDTVSFLPDYSLAEISRC